MTTWKCYGCHQPILKGQRWKHYNTENKIFVFKHRLHKDCELDWELLRA